MNYAALTARVEEHLRRFFASQEDHSFVYHDLSHTEGVVKAAAQIANHYQLTERDFFIVMTAAWFHDTGYFEDYEHHETRSAELAGEFLQRESVDDATIQTVKGCILATRMPQAAQNRLEEIVCDADLFHLGTAEFADKNKLMRKEAEAKKGRNITKEEWRRGTIRLFESHHYYTDYCQLLLNDRKKQNLEKLRMKAAAAAGKHGNERTEPLQVVTDNPHQQGAVPAATEETTARKKKIESNRPDRGIETMFRITSTNNQRLSDMADNKANIMITVNSIILSAIISLLLRKLDDNSNLVIPTYIILAVSVLTIIFSILATRPSLPNGRFTKNDLDEKKVNLLFFGNFYRMNLSDYNAGMQEVMNDRDFLYGTLVKDVYSQGVVLGRKYRLLRISYTIFMFGLIISVLAFVIATLFVIR